MMDLGQFQLQLPSSSARWLVAGTFAPSEALLVGALTGYALVKFGKFSRHTAAILITGFVFASAIFLWSLSLAFSQELFNAQPLADFVTLVGGTRLPSLFHGDPVPAAAAVLIVILEAGFLGAAGVASASLYRTYGAKGEGKMAPVRGPAQPVKGGLTGGPQARPSQIPDGSVRRGGPSAVQQEAPPDAVPLSADERTVMELFLFNRAERLQPTVDLRRPEGFSFQEIPGVDWEPARLMRVLDSLGRRGLLHAELLDKLLLCKSCGSAALQLSSGCPECRSVNLTRHQVVEHFTCGLIDKEEAFQTEGHDLTCPKCHRTLKMVGSDYRKLSPMYICQECNAMNRDLSQVMKCSTCGTAAPVDEEDERPLYSYELKEEAAVALRPQIKPIEVFTSHLRSRGFTVVSPAVIVGRSGARHTFDLAIMAPGHGNGEPERNPPRGVVPAGGTAIEIMISSSPVGVEEIAGVYGKVNDLDCSSIIFVIPGLSENARNYAASSGLRVFEGETIEEALAGLDASAPKMREGGGAD
jgi:Thaumarchaeal output domain 1